MQTKSKNSMMKYYCLSSALIILSLNSIITLCSSKAILNSATDKHALLSFKTSLISDPNAILSKNWSHDAPVCNWTGVSCGLKHRRVTALDLSGYDLAGTVSPYLGNLTFLRYLDISSNNFTGFLPLQHSKLRRLKVMNVAINSFGGEIPTWLGSLPQLEKVYMDNNSFSGGIPPSLFNSSKLRVLSMRFNLVDGNIPEEIGNASSLEILDLSYNLLSGSVPRGLFNISSMKDIRIAHNILSGSLPGDMCNDFPNLEILTLSYNQLSGEIPGNIWKCRDLETLSLSYNHFNGSIPSEIGNLSMLRLLYLGMNNLQGIPPNTWKCRQLEDLDLSNNKLSGSIPFEVGNMSMLKVLRLSKNDFTGELPQEIGTLSFLQYFSVFNNSLSGSIPHSIFNVSTLKTLALSFNNFSGSLPSDMGHSLFNLEKLFVAANSLEGPIPTSITNASKLTTFDISDNLLSGFIPNFGDLRFLQIFHVWGNSLSGAEFPTQELTFLSSLTHCRNLMMLDLTYNPLNGILPTSIGTFSSSLLYFYAEYSNIGGVIPSEIGNLSKLLDMALEGNQLIGHIPPTIGKLKQLQRLILSNNQLVGSIPNDVCQMKHLGDLSFVGNMLIGLIPKCLGEVTSLRTIDLSSNLFNSTIPPNFWNLIDLVTLNLSSNHFSGQLSPQLGNLRSINSVDLSFNQLSGDIPSTIDGCQSLETLNLSNNEFTGSIPQSVGNVKCLEELDLSSNKFSGLLPKSIANLKLLWNFNVSYNKLEGKIPNEGCFVNFTAQSFTHNSALCGPTRFQVSSCPEDHGESRVKRFFHHMKYVVPSVILAVILVIVLILLARKHFQKKVSLSPTNIWVGIEWRRISYIELERGTTSFSETNLLGRGSFGSVFQATLVDGLKVAVKVFDLQLERAARSFETESELLSTIRHRNIVHVIGCCSNMEFKALILEYMPNKSLEKWLYSDNYCLDLVQRVKIAIDVALALEYLHHGYTFPVVHCDIKPSNVLLDEDMTARVADFGISKLFDKGEDLIQTKTLATIGYVAPEYGSEGKVSTNGDVYSYGIMLLEMFTCRKPTDEMFSSEMGLKEWVGEALLENATSEVVDPRLLAREDRHFSEMEQYVTSILNLAMKCLASAPIERINMIEATTTLSKTKATFEAGTIRRH